MRHGDEKKGIPEGCGFSGEEREAWQTEQEAAQSIEGSVTESAKLERGKN